MRVIPEEALRLMRSGATVTMATLAVQRSNLSSRRAVLREANRRGKWFGIVSRGMDDPIEHDEAVDLAYESARGNDTYYHCAVPERWRRLFEAAFVKAAVFAANTERAVSVRSV